MTENQNSETQEKLPAGFFPFQLIDIRLYEISVRRGVDMPQSEPETESNDSTLSILLHAGDEPLDADEFALLLTLELKIPSPDETGCRIFLALEGLFQATADISNIKPEHVERFRSSDALIIFWPYLRQALDDIAVRTRLSIAPLPIIDPSALVSFADEGTAGDSHD